MFRIEEFKHLQNLHYISFFFDLNEFNLCKKIRSTCIPTLKKNVKQYTHLY